MSLGGRFVPAGTQIGSSPLAIHHSKKIFREDAETFRPERWLEADKEKLAVIAISTWTRTFASRFRPSEEPSSSI